MNKRIMLVGLFFVLAILWQGSSISFGLNNTNSLKQLKPIQVGSNMPQDKNAQNHNTNEYYDILVVGAGLSGAVIAERMASQSGLRVLVLEKRNHIGGNCYDYTDTETNLLVSAYGLHLFHTNHQHVWNYIQQFSKWTRWDHWTLGYVDQKFVPIPVNIKTVNMLFEQNISSSAEMDQWLYEVQGKYHKIHNSEEMAISRVGNDLYEKIFLPYTLKQWDKHPRELDAEVTARIPVRNNFDDRYFTDKFQALPSNGYTAFFEKLLTHPNITVQLNTDYSDFIKTNPNIIYKTLYYTGPIDQYFNMPANEQLEYRSLRFEKQVVRNHAGYVQPASQVNYPSTQYNFTRIVEYKWFLHQKSPHSILFKEYSSSDGEPYYPVPSPRNKQLYLELQLKALLLGSSIVFVGRLANYKYFNMDEAIANALQVYQKTRPNAKKCLKYSNRYETCLWLRDNVLNKTQLAEVFMAFGKKPNSTEVVIFRMNNKQAWSNDYWLSVCSLVTESSSVHMQRDVILHITLEAWPWIPEEFKTLAFVNDAQVVKNTYPYFQGAFVHGDMLMAYLLLHTLKLQQYSFLWAVEEDCRINGQWSNLFDFRNNNTNADLIVWHGKHYDPVKSFNRQTWWHQPQYYHGKWASNLPAMMGAWTMAFGISYHMAEVLLKNLAEGTYNDNQEINLITSANELPDMTIAYGDIRREWECCNLGKAQVIYDSWMKDIGTCLHAPFLMHAVKIP